jgi:hypothetical protein
MPVLLEANSVNHPRGNTSVTARGEAQAVPLPALLCGALGRGTLGTLRWVMRELHDFVVGMRDPESLNATTQGVGVQVEGFRASLRPCDKTKLLE